jgi:hypothetical protein
MTLDKSNGTWSIVYGGEKGGGIGSMLGYEFYLRLEGGK